MSRQPFLPSFGHLEYAVGALALNNRPELAAAIGRCFAIWSYADNEIGNLLGILLEADSEVAIEVFSRLRRSANQIEVLGCAAKIKLTGEDLRFYMALISVYGSLEQERNALAHGCFGVAANDTSVLLWISVKDHVKFQTDVLARYARGESVPDPHARLKESLYVYTALGLSAIQRDMEQFWKAAMCFNSYLRFRSNPDQQMEFERIKKQPVIKRALDSLVQKNA
jgi:hypothetical protein